MDHKKLNRTFNKFAGREVKVIENPQEIDIGGNKYKFLNPHIAKNDAVTAEIRTEAKQNGFSSTRAWLPESVGSMDYNTSRLNYKIRKEADGKYRVQKNSFSEG